MDALGAARMGDEIAHGAGILGMLAGAVIGAVVAVAVVAAVAATGGLALVIFAAAIAGGALAANQILKGLKTIFELPDPTTGVLASGSHNVFTNTRPAARATLDYAAICTGGSFPFITHPYWPFPVTIAEGSKTVTINSMPAARITMLMTCSAFIKTASDNVFIGGPTASTEFVWDWTGWLETGFTWLGYAAMAGAAVFAAMAGVAALATLVAVVGVSFLAFEGLGMLGDAIGPGYRDLFQGIAGMGLLLAGPKMARRAAFEDMYGKAPGAKSEIDAIAGELARKNGGKVAEAPIKSRTRALEKINDDYEGNPTKIKDLARNTIVVDEAAVPGVAKDLSGMGAKVKVISAENDPMGYSGVNSTINTKAGIPGEIQVNSPEMIFAKETPSNARAILGDEAYNKIADKTPVEGGLGHKYYEEYRVLPDKSSPEAQAIAQKSRDYYDIVRSSNSGH